MPVTHSRRMSGNWLQHTHMCKGGPSWTRILESSPKSYNALFRWPHVLKFKAYLELACPPMVMLPLRILGSGRQRAFTFSLCVLCCFHCFLLKCGRQLYDFGFFNLVSPLLKPQLCCTSSTAGLPWCREKEQEAVEVPLTHMHNCFRDEQGIQPCVRSKLTGKYI